MWWQPCLNEVECWSISEYLHFYHHVLDNINYQPEWGCSERNTSRIFKHITGKKLITPLRVAVAVKAPPCVNEIASCVLRGCPDWPSSGIRISVCRCDIMVLGWEWMDCLSLSGACWRVGGEWRRRLADTSGWSLQWRGCHSGRLCWNKSWAASQPEIPHLSEMSWSIWSWWCPGISLGVFFPQACPGKTRIQYVFLGILPQGVVARERTGSAPHSNLDPDKWMETNEQ